MRLLAVIIISIQETYGFIRRMNGAVAKQRIRAKPAATQVDQFGDALNKTVKAC